MGQLALAKEEGLCIDGVLGVAAGTADVAAIGLHDADPGFVAEVDVENVLADVADQAGVLNGDEGFDAAVEVAGHHVGAAQEEVGLAAVVEVVDAGVFEKAADDGTN
jgi:hypothetical protein